MTTRRPSQPSQPARSSKPATPTPPTPPPPDKRATAEILIRQTTEIALERTGWNRRQLEIAALAATAIIAICILGSLAAISASAGSGAPTATFIPLPVVQATNIPPLFQSAGYTISNLQKQSVPNATWTAPQAIRFDVAQDKDKLRGSVLVLSYADALKAGQDAFRVSLSDKWKTWTMLQYNDLLVMIAPGMPDALKAKLTAVLNQELLIKYRPYLQTATPTP